MNIKEYIVKNFCTVKSIITFMVAIGLLIFVGQDKISGDDFYKIVLMVFTFYFGSQAAKALETPVKSGSESPVETPKTTVSITTTPPPVQVITGAKTGDLEESAADVGEV